jgi:POT family proton-dependent oligopeptide transporter
LESSPSNPFPLVFQYVGFWLSYLLPTIVFLICPLVLIFGKKLYIMTPPSGSV